MDEQNKNNIVGICKNCAEERQNTAQEILKQKPLQQGDFVKIKIGSGKTIEHCWFKVLEITKDQFLGMLDNYTCYKQKINYADEQWFNLTEIEDIIRREQLDRR